MFVKSPTPFRFMRVDSILAVLTFFGAFMLPTAHGGENERELTGVLLTWKSDPATTMVVDWHEKSKVEKPTLEFRKKGEESWQIREADTIPFPHSDRFIFRTELTGLEPDTLYEFRPAGQGEPFLFQTAQAELKRPVTVAVGGDMMHEKEDFERMNRVVATWDVDFIIMGGDYAYSDGNPKHVKKEYDWMDAVLNTLVSKDRKVPPIIGAIGNHEVRNRDFKAIKEAGGKVDAQSALDVAPFYMTLFAFPGFPTYGALDFGDYLSVILLDSDHLIPVEGKQTEWLEETLASRAKDPHRILFPVYHVGAYPSVRDWERSPHRDIRELWSPLFDKHGLSIAFEFHDHAYKRTHPILGGEIQKSAEDGVTYVGDGAWGVRLREPAEKRDYLAKAGATQHVHRLEIPVEGPIRLQAINGEGEVFDEFQVPRRRSSGGEKTGETSDPTL